MSNKIHIGIVQINAVANLSRVRWHGRKLKGGSIAPSKTVENNEATHYELIPYLYGLLKTYIVSSVDQPDLYRFLDPIYTQTSVDDAVAALRCADVVGFSIYVWNERISLDIARALKKKNRNVLIVFGGPSVPARADCFLRKNPFIDLLCHGEGEKTFFQIIQHLKDRNWQNIPSVSYLDPSKGTISNASARIENLSEIPSPYLNRSFDSIIKQNPDKKWIALFETNRGCPHSCSYCAWGNTISDKVVKFEMDRIRGELQWMAESKIELIMCCDANFGLLSRDKDIIQHGIDLKKKYGYPQNISIQNSMNSGTKTCAIHEMLHESNMHCGATIGIQSMTENVLSNVCRKKLSEKNLASIQEYYSRMRIDSYCDMILALPGETYESFTEGLSRVLSCGQYNRVYMYNFCILPNTEASDPEFKHQHQLSTVHQRIMGTHCTAAESCDEAGEHLDTVVSTLAMPAHKWIDSKVFFWLVDIFYFDRVLQVPFIIAHTMYAVSYKHLVEAFLKSDATTYPVTSAIVLFLKEKARLIQETGSPELIFSDQWMGVWWPIDQYVIADLAATNRLDAFYGEAERIITQCLSEHRKNVDNMLISESIDLNQSLFRLPFNKGNVVFHASSDLKGLYRSVLGGYEIPLRREPVSYEIVRTRPEWTSWNDWFEHLAFCHLRKEYYIYGLRKINSGDTNRCRQPMNIKN